MRGIASLAVCWFHLTNSYSQESFVRISGSFGWMGIEVFFVISGFIIPYAMFLGGYRLPGDWKTFMVKRLIRLEPPYLLSVVLALVLWHLSSLSPTFGGKSPPLVTSPEVWLHLGYLNGVAGLPWLNIVYWTLAIEFQFYLVCSVAIGLLSSRTRLSAASVLALLLLSWALPSSALVFKYLPLFALGIATFQYRIGIASKAALALMIGSAALATWGVHGPVAAGAALTATSVLLIRPSWARSRILLWLGAISYSLYLIHVPVGGRVINFGRRFVDSQIGEALLSLVAAAVTLACAYAFYLAVERPCQRVAARIRYGSKELSAAVEAQSAVVK